MLPIKKGYCASSTQCREIVSALRKIGALESPKGYYDLSIAHEDHEALKVESTIVQVYQYTFPEDQERVTRGHVPSVWGLRFYPRAEGED